MLDKKTVREIAAKYAKEVRNILDPEAVILFGSYVNGTPHEYSDIDIAVIMNNYQGNWYETAIKLCSLRELVSVDIEPHLMDETYDPGGFLEHIKKTGEVIYRCGHAPVAANEFAGAITDNRI